jgi:uncharacterized protein YnzC (UPF0291/DUF896 family)
MKRKFIALSILCAVFIELTHVASAQEELPAPAPQPQPPAPFLLNPRAVERLGLTDAQKENYAALEKEYLEKRADLNIDDSAVRKAYQARRAAEQSGDPAKIEQARRHFESVRDEHLKRAQPLIALRDEYLKRLVQQILTPEQAKIIDPKGKFSEKESSPAPQQ